MFVQASGRQPPPERAVFALFLSKKPSNVLCRVWYDARREWRPFGWPGGVTAPGWHVAQAGGLPGPS
jgi:hypothetical protein